MDPAYSEKEYPRKDKAFYKFQSLDFWESKAKIFERHEIMQNKHSVLTEVKLWLVFCLIGVFVGTIAFLLALTEEYVTEIKIWVTQHFM